MGVEFTRSTALLALTTSISSSVATLTVSTAAALTALTVASTATAEGASLALTLAHHSSGRSVRSLLLDVGSRDDLSGEVKPLSEVVETLGGQGVVVPLPRELSLDIAAGRKALEGLDYEEVLGVDFGVLGQVVVLGGCENSLPEEVLVNLLSIGLGDEHLGGVTLVKMSLLSWMVDGKKDLEKGQTSRGDFSIGTESFNGVRKKTLEGNSTLERCGLGAILVVKALHGVWRNSGAGPKFDGTGDGFWEGGRYFKNVQPSFLPTNYLLYPSTFFLQYRLPIGLDIKHHLCHSQGYCTVLYAV